ncbi:MAG: hypothetical protein KDA96_23065, partial [Planctomycetaceae bacterium]|nr:hypothetical protein [Planctomycetaceae bacterium]
AVAGNVSITALGDVLLSAGTDTNFNRDQYTMEARTDSFAGSAIPLDKVDSDATLLQDNRITIAAGANVNSAGDIKLHAERLGLANMASRAKAVNWASAAASAINSALGGQDAYDGTITVGATGIVDVLGTLQTGIKRNRTLILGDKQPGQQPTGWDASSGEITTYTNDSGIEYTQGFAVLESGLFLQLNAARANLERYRTSNTVLRDFYQLEINRISAELLSRGLASLESDGSITAREQYVMTVTVRPTTAQAGIIDVRGDALTGTGALNAPRDASVTIVNNTPARLILQGITIPEQVGGVFLNGEPVLNNAAITAINIPDQAAANFGAITPSTDTLAGAPQIQLENTFDGSSWTGAGTYPTPDILVTGDVTNYSGSFTAIAVGDVIYRASIRAANITTIAGGSVFIDGLTSYSVGGDPYGKLKTLGNGIAAYDQTAALNLLTANPTTVSLLGDTIIINAEFININGIVQSGKDNYSLTLPSSLNTEIANIRASSGARYTLLSVSNQDFKAFYDRVEDKILLKEVRVSGGNVQLTGHILSTGGGTIRVLNGYGNINVNNQTSVDIEIERLDVSQRGSGTLLLADKAKGTSANPAVTLYGNQTQSFMTTDGSVNVRTGESVRLAAGYSGGGTPGEAYEYLGAFGSVNLGAENYANTARWRHLTSPTAPVDGTYSPDAGWRYGFSVAMQTATRTTTTYGSSAWLGIDALARDPSNITSGPYTEIISQPKLLPEGTYYFKNAGITSNYTYATQTYNTQPPRSYQTAQWSTSTWYGKTTNYQTWVTEVYQETVSTHTFKADRGIAIDFIGTESPTLTVQSNNGGRILLAGPVLNPAGTTTLQSASGILQTN